MTSIPADLADRKSLGAWYTPISIVKPLARWAVRSSHDHVLDPAVGDGVFLAEAARCFRHDHDGRTGVQLHGVDVNPDAVAASRAAVADILGSDDPPDLRLTDFFLIDPPASLLGDFPRVDAVVGNPPYIRYQTFTGPSRTAALLQAERVGVRLTGLSSSWAPFVIHAASFLRSGGRLALVLPEELLHAAYASAVRRFLRRTFRLTVVVQFDDHVFPESQERVVLLLAEGKGESPVGELRLAGIRRPENIEDLREVIESGEVFSPDTGPQKWERQFDDFAARILSHLENLDYLVPLRTIGKANIGYVSGANDYFVFTPSQARNRSFPLRLLKPTVVSARQVPGAVLTADDLGNLKEQNERCLLWTGSGTDLRQVTAYIREGGELGISSRYKCRKRDPWFVVPGVVEPDAIMTYMSDEFPRLILNTARATCANTLLTVNLVGVSPSVQTALVAAYYNSATLLSAERIGRRYGGGVLKMEPSEADRLLVPNPVVVKQLTSVKSLLSRIDRLLRLGNVGQVLAEIDSVFLKDLCGLSGGDLREVQDSRLRRREARKRKPVSSSAYVSPHQ